MVDVVNEMIIISKGKKFIKGKTTNKYANFLGKKYTFKFSFHNVRICNFGFSFSISDECIERTGLALK